MALRLLYLIAIRVFGWLVLLVLVNATSAIFTTGMPCADSNTTGARRHVTTDRLPRPVIRNSRAPSSSPIP